MIYRGKEYQAFQQTPDAWIDEKNRRNGKVLLIAEGKKLTVNKREIRPEQPTLFVYSAEGCAPCHYILTAMKNWIQTGYCNFELEEIDSEKADLSKDSGPPGFEGQFPFVAYLHPNGRWQTFLQFQDKQFSDMPDYLKYLWNTIDACSLPAY